MKKLSFLVVALFFTQLLCAKEYKLVLKSTNKPGIGYLEVKSNDDVDDDGETVIIKSGSDVTTITVTVKDIYGAVLSQDAVPASEDGTYVLTIPDYPNGIIIEVKDEKGCVCSFYNN